MQKHIKPSDNSGVGVVDRVFIDQEVAHRENSDRHYARKRQVKLRIQCKISANIFGTSYSIA